ncbi:MAG: hypothetical protein ACRC2T_10110, partial [Thermoguttaceae bacterium]
MELQAPTLTLNTVTATSASLSWGSSSGAANYIVQASQNNVYWYTVYNNTGLSSTINNLPSTKITYFRVKAVAGASESSWSNTVSATTTGTNIAVPFSLSVSRNNNNAVLTWDLSSSSLGTYIQISTDNDNWTMIEPPVQPGVKTKTITGLSDTQAYYFRIATYTTSGGFQSLWVYSENDLIVTNLNDTGTGSLRQCCLDAISGQTIYFLSTLKNGTITLGSQIAITDKYVTIDATNLLNADGTPGITLRRVPAGIVNNRHFTCTNRGIRAIGIQFSNGGFEGTLTTTDIDDWRGGSISCINVSEQYKAEFRNCSWSNCRMRCGGALSFDRSYFLFENCEFYSNSASENGGDLYVYTSTGTVDNCRFSLSASGMGGSVCADVGSALFLSNCSF